MHQFNTKQFFGIVSYFFCEKYHCGPVVDENDVRKVFYDGRRVLRVSPVLVVQRGQSRRRRFQHFRLQHESVSEKNHFHLSTKVGGHQDWVRSPKGLTIMTKFGSDGVEIGSGSNFNLED